MKTVHALVAGGLILGFALGYGVAYQTFSSATMHLMPDGTVMENSDSNMEAMMHDMNAALRGKTGDEFDQAFLQEMIVHHEGAVDMAELALQSAGHQEIKDLAAAIIAAQNGEIASMRGWLSAWYGL